MSGPWYNVSLLERQISMSLLAHAARHDDEALAASLEALATEGPELRPEGVMAALLAQFQQGMDEEYGDQLAEFFAQAAQGLAANADPNPLTHD